RGSGRGAASTSGAPCMGSAADRCRHGPAGGARGQGPDQAVIASAETVTVWPAVMAPSNCTSPDPTPAVRSIRRVSAAFLRRTNVGAVAEPPSAELSCHVPFFDFELDDAAAQGVDGRVMAASSVWAPIAVSAFVGGV